LPDGILRNAKQGPNPGRFGEQAGPFLKYGNGRFKRVVLSKFECEAESIFFDFGREGNSGLIGLGSLDVLASLFLDVADQCLTRRGLGQLTGMM